MGRAGEEFAIKRLKNEGLLKKNFKGFAVWIPEGYYLNKIMEAIEMRDKRAVEDLVSEHDTEILAALQVAKYVECGETSLRKG